MNEMRSVLEDTVERMFGEMVTREVREQGERREWPARLWGAVEESGLARCHVAEDLGGAGGGWREAFVVLSAAGRHAVPLPLGETMLGAWMLAQAGREAPPGPLTVLPDPLPAAALAGGRLTARASRVPWGGAAGHAVFVVAEEGRARVGLVETGGAGTVPGENLAREPRDELAFDRVAAETAPVALPLETLGRLGAMIRAAQMAGALGYLLEQSVRYAGERVQFGRPIGRFQVIQHALAVLAGQAAASEAAAGAAFAAADRATATATWRGESAPTFEIAVAKVRVGEAAEAAPAIAHQIHGAIGFTYEHDLHFATRRLWSWRSEFGSETFWADYLGRRAFEAGPRGLWPLLTSR